MLQRAISRPLGIYEVLTAPHGRLSGSHITLDLPAHECNTHPNHSESQMATIPAASQHAFQLSPHSGKGHCSAVSTKGTQEMSRDPKSDERILEFLHPKLGKLRRTDFNLKKSNIYRLLNLKKKKNCSRSRHHQSGSSFF